MSGMKMTPSQWDRRYEALCRLELAARRQELLAKHKACQARGADAAQQASCQYWADIHVATAQLLLSKASKVRATLDAAVWA